MATEKELFIFVASLSGCSYKEISRVLIFSLESICLLTQSAIVDDTEIKEVVVKKSISQHTIVAIFIVLYDKLFLEFLVFIICNYTTSFTNINV
ncbi:hypothetical protein QAC84_05200 [Staphylococcus aureus]|nr:hypothetical protein [Staphylococcus aureus]HCX3586127.1 hypothetical protein [Staphylococcus aureus]HDA5633440.1 hypothetical protein [Staphylococcus aureus]HDF3612677.1 hypothetical protein [Staphylococcus aureus]HDF6305915.1 hypothetical protein [Staphylococcus aureus]